MAHYVKIAWEWLSVGFQLLFLSVGSKRIKKGFFVCDGLGKTKNLFLLALCGEKQVLMAVGEPLERGRALDGWVQIRQR